MNQVHSLRRRRRSRWVLGSRLGSAVAVVGLALVGAPASASPSIPEAGACPVVAGAQGLQLMASASDNLFLAAPTGAGVPVAQTCVDVRIGDSTGYASSPYPGETVLSLVGSKAPFPGYASSRHPTDPRSKVDGPGFAMTSTSKEHSSKATAKMGLSEQPAHAASTVASAQSFVDPATGEATATATSDTEPLTINDVLELGRIRSSATATVTAGGKLQRDSMLQVGRTAVAGQEVQITPDGVEAVGEKVAGPGADPNDVLGAAGIELRLVKEQQAPQGVVSAGIEIIARQTNPDSGEEYVVHYTVGRAFASAVAVEPGSGVGVPPVSPPSPVPTDAPSANEGTAVSTETGSISSGSAAPRPAPAAAPVPEIGSSPPRQPVIAAPVQRATNPVDIGAAALYLTLAFSALALFAGGTLLRLLGVKTR